MASKRLVPLLSQSLRCGSRTALSSSPRTISLISGLSIRQATRARSQLFVRPLSSTPHTLKESPPASSQSKIYDYTQFSSLISSSRSKIQSTSSSPSSSSSASSSQTNNGKQTIIIDVREPSELQATGTIPGAKNIPLKSAADAFFLGEEEFEDRFGFPRPDTSDGTAGDVGKEVEVEVVFFCKAGVRSKAAAELARRAGWEGREGGEGRGRVVIGEYPGSWDDWSARGGDVEKV